MFEFFVLVDFLLFVQSSYPLLVSCGNMLVFGLSPHFASVCIISSFTVASKF